MKYKALIVEDNAEIASLVQLHLRDIDCQAEIAMDGQQGLDCFASGRYDLVILDLMLPEMDGLEVCRRLRQSGDYVPIIMLTSRSSEIDRVLGLEVGADDYISKPFSIPELLARCKIQFRHLEARQQEDAVSPEHLRISHGQLLIDDARHEVQLAGKVVQLTAKEFSLLLHFARHPGRVFTRMQLLEQVWNYRYAGYEHTVNSHINRLRNKIETDPAKPHFILTVWGVGYQFNEHC